MNKYNIVISNTESTVVSEYNPTLEKSNIFQTENDLEKEFIKILRAQEYEYLLIKNENDLILNLRKQMERLNNYTFSNNEWNNFFKQYIANKSEGLKEKTKKIQIDYIQPLQKDDNTTKNIILIDKENIHNNHLQVINQYEAVGENHKNRYDVTILVNGLPLVHVELKKRGVNIREAFHQMQRYQKDSFWAGSGLFDYIQIFVISNGTNTKYYSNSTRDNYFNEQLKRQSYQGPKTSNSFEFTSFWADANNKNIKDLIDFTKTFFAKHSLLNVLTKYCIFTAKDLLLVMRPYQIVATERILSKINITNNYKKFGSTEAGGFIWHTTGSGKTLTSFKTAQLASKLNYIDKVLFVVDRKDLDYQTMKEYDQFEKGAANSNKSTKILQTQIEDNKARIIVTTIQKLDLFITKNKNHPAFEKHFVIIFDECHRSQFGEMHNRIIKSFKKYHLFGFTGTPIFANNANKNSDSFFKTTPQAFGEQLHSYTIVNAINDKNVLPFRIEFYNTFKKKNDIEDTQVKAIDTKKVIEDPQRIGNIVKYIIQNFDKKTKRSQTYNFHGERLYGFNSIFAVNSIDLAKQYYTEFQQQIQETNAKLNVAIIFSYSPNENTEEFVLPDETFETEDLDASSKQFLEQAIQNYNKIFQTNYDTSPNKFENYYKDVSDRVKNKQIDLLIVVNMFLTGFDATTVNTLWVDKNLKHHGLLQAFSRTNRILNSIKTFGNIICFRNLEQETEEAIALFGDKNASGIVLMKNYAAYYYGYEENNKHYPGYCELVDELQKKYPIGTEIMGEEAQKKFIQLFNSILRLKNILSAFDEFENKEILLTREFQDYQSMYIDLYKSFNKTDNEKEKINEDIEFEIELIKQVDINIDYIFKLIKKYHETNCEDEEIKNEVFRNINSHFELRSKKILVEEFINELNLIKDPSQIEQNWRKFIYEKKERDLNQIIEEENLKPYETHELINHAFQNGFLKTTGTDINKIMPAMSRFDNENKRIVKKESVITKLSLFFEKYSGLVTEN